MMSPRLAGAGRFPLQLAFDDVQMSKMLRERLRDHKRCVFTIIEQKNDFIGGNGLLGQRVQT
jgi:hypothetical protein